MHVLRCPSLGTPWLLASLPTEAAVLLMRGTAQAQQPPDDLPVGHYL